MSLQESIRRILREEDYSPAGKEVIPNEIVIHKSNPIWRKNILETGLLVSVGECYETYVGYGEKCTPAIFATNSTNKRDWFDSTYDDDIWEINTEMIPDVKWYEDRHFESKSKHIVTFQDIPKEALTLKYEGTGSGDVETWSKDSPNLSESIRRILREEKDQTKLIKGIIDSSDIFDYKHFCGVDIISPEERTGPFLIKVYFIGGPNSKVWPRTQAVRNKEYDLIEELHEHITSFVPFNIEMMASHVNSCDGYEKVMKRKYSTEDLQESIRNILREETDSGKYVNAVKVIANDYKNENFVCDIDVRYYRGFYEIGVKIDKKEFEKKYENEDINYATILMAEHLKTLQKTIRQEIKNFLPVDVMVWINKTNCDKSLNESENKKSKLLSNIEENGLYDVISSTGLHVNEIEQKVGQLSREVLERFIKDVVKEHFQVIDDDGQTYIIYLEDYPFDAVPIGNSDYVDQLRVINNELFFLVTLYEEDEYGDLEEQSHEVAPSKNLLYYNIYEIAGQLAYLIVKGQI
jgi:hypothetical protein